MNNNEIKVGFLVSYDYEYLKNSLPRVYNYINYIAIAIDKNRLTWSGNKFSIPDSFFEWLDKFDFEKKIHIYEDDFYDPDLTPIENDSRERRMLGKFMGKGGWHIQIDTDEYFLDFKSFVDYLVKYIDYNKEIIVQVPVYSIFKQDSHGSYIVVDTNEYFPLGTNNPNYNRARYTPCENFCVIPTPIIHQSWGKDIQQIKNKITNWGHKLDFDTEEYLKLWDFVDPFTYKYLKNIHPIYAPMWGALEYIPAIEIPQILDYFKQKEYDNIKKSAKQSKISVSDFLPPIFYKIKRAVKRKIK